MTPWYKVLPLPSSCYPSNWYFEFYVLLEQFLTVKAHRGAGGTFLMHSFHEQIIFNVLFLGENWESCLKGLMTQVDSSLSLHWDLLHLLSLFPILSSSPLWCFFVLSFLTPAPIIFSSFPLLLSTSILVLPFRLLSAHCEADTLSHFLLIFLIFLTHLHIHAVSFLPGCI